MTTRKPNPSSRRGNDKPSFQGDKREGNRPRSNGPFKPASGPDNRSGEKSFGDKPGGFRKDDSRGGFGARKEGGDNRPYGKREGSFRKEGGQRDEQKPQYGAGPSRGGNSSHGSPRERFGKESKAEQHTGGEHNNRRDKPYTNDKGRDKDYVIDFPDTKKGGRPFKPRHEQVEEKMPLNKYIAHCGICSRRDAVDLIKSGKVLVNGKPVNEPGYKVQDTDKVTYGTKQMSVQKNLVYLLLNKPKGFITTTEDPQGRKTVMDLVASATEDRIFPVGRLDRNTSGLLLLTNDGELAQKLAHPSNNIKKVYHVGLDKDLTKVDYEKIMAGLALEDGVANVDALAYLEPGNKRELGIEIHIGRNRIIRRIFESLGYEVEKLDRVLYAGLTKKNIPRGKWRFLNEKEVIYLKHYRK